MKRPSTILFIILTGTFILYALIPSLVCATNKTEAENLIEKGLLYYEVKQYKKAIIIWTRSLELDPTLHNVYYYRGMAWYAMGEFDSALTEFNKSLEIMPKYGMAFSSRGFVWKKKGLYDHAIADFRNALSANPNLPQPYSQLAWIYALCPNERYRNGAQAVIWAKKAQKFSNRPKTMSPLLAAAYAEAGDFDEAVATQKKAIAWMQREGMVSELDNANIRLKYYQNHIPPRKKNIPGEEQKTKEAAKNRTGGEDYAESEVAKEKSEVVLGRTESASAPLLTPVETPVKAVEKTPAPEVTPQHSDTFYPYVIQVSAYREPEKSINTALELRKKGDTAFTAYAVIPKKGEWYRVFVGYYQTFAKAKESAALLKERRFMHGIIHKKPWAISIGDFVDEKEIQQMEDALLQKGYLAYRITKDEGKATRLLIGAYKTPQEAHEMSKRIKANGFSLQVVKR
jgi:tetratricopeptide (TPR) repeat protein